MTKLPQKMFVGAYGRHSFWMTVEKKIENRIIVSSCLTIEQFWEKMNKKVQVGKDQEKAQSEKDSHSKNRGGKKTK